jgi:hypothetical protein
MRPGIDGYRKLHPSYDPAGACLDDAIPSDNRPSRHTPFPLRPL